MTTRPVRRAHRRSALCVRAAAVGLLVLLVGGLSGCDPGGGGGGGGYVVQQAPSDLSPP